MSNQCPLRRVVASASHTCIYNICCRHVTLCRVIALWASAAIFLAPCTSRRASPVPIATSCAHSVRTTAHAPAIASRLCITPSVPFAVIAPIRHACPPAASSVACALLHSPARHIAVLRSCAHTLAIIHYTTCITLHIKLAVALCVSRHRCFSAASHRSSRRRLHGFTINPFVSRFAGRIS